MDDESTSCDDSNNLRGSISRSPISTYLYNESSLYKQSDQLVVALLGGKKNGNQINGFGRSYDPKSAREPPMSATLPIRPRPKDFLAPSCNSAVIRNISPKSITETENRRLKKIGLQSREVYNWAGTTLHSADSYGRYERSLKSIDMDTVVTKDPAINASTKQWKMDSLSKNKAEQLLWQEEAKTKKNIRNDAQELRIKFRKSLDDFRQKLRERLKEKQESLVGSVMRCIDEGMAHHFIENHKMLDLSVDATLALMGLSDGTGGGNTELSKIDITPGNNSEFIYPGENYPGDYNGYNLTNLNNGKNGNGNNGNDLNGNQRGSMTSPGISPFLDENPLGIFEDYKEYNEEFVGTNHKIPWGSPKTTGGSGKNLPMKKLNKSKSMHVQAHKNYSITHKNDLDNITPKEISIRAFNIAQLDDKIKSGKVTPVSEYPVGGRRKTVNSIMSFYQHNDSLPQLVASSVPQSDIFAADILTKRLIITDNEINMVKETIASRRKSIVKPNNLKTPKSGSRTPKSDSCTPSSIKDPIFMTEKEMEVDALIEIPYEIDDDEPIDRKLSASTDRKQSNSIDRKNSNSIDRKFTGSISRKHSASTDRKLSNSMDRKLSSSIDRKFSSSSHTNSMLNNSSLDKSSVSNMSHDLQSDSKNLGSKSVDERTLETEKTENTERTSKSEKTSKTDRSDKTDTAYTINAASIKLASSSDTIKNYLSTDDMTDINHSDDSSVSTVSQMHVPILPPTNILEITINPINIPIEKNSTMAMIGTYHRKNIEILLSSPLAPLLPPNSNLGVWSAPTKKGNGRYIIRHSNIVSTANAARTINANGLSTSPAPLSLQFKPFFS